MHINPEKLIWWCLLDRWGNWGLEGEAASLGHRELVVEPGPSDHEILFISLPFYWILISSWSYSLQNALGWPLWGAVGMTPLHGAAFRTYQNVFGADSLINLSIWGSVFLVGLISSTSEIPGESVMLSKQVLRQPCGSGMVAGGMGYFVYVFVFCFINWGNRIRPLQMTKLVLAKRTRRAICEKDQGTL